MYVVYRSPQISMLARTPPTTTKIRTLLFVRLGQEVFLNMSGTSQAALVSLSGGLWDYNVSIKLNALEILCVLTASTFGGPVRQCTPIPPSCLTLA